MINNINTPKLINKRLDTFKDNRGSLEYLNELDFSYFKRFYFITHSTTQSVRAWQGHPKESKVFIPTRGSFVIAVVKIDDFESPSKDLKPNIFRLSSCQKSALIIPDGYANGLKAIVPDSELLVLSEFELVQSVNEKIRFDQNLWINWNEY